MHIAFLNPQGNFDARDSHWTEHPDFGGQLVYVKEVAQAMAADGHQVDIVTRQIIDPEWPQFSEPLDHYPGHEDNLRILRIPCGGDAFLAKEQLWDHLGAFVDAMLAFYGDALPQFATAHYADGGYCAALAGERAGIGFSFTGHSLGAQKLDKLGTSLANIDAMEARYRFSRRIAAERLAMSRASMVITSTRQEWQEQYAHPLYEGAVDVGEPGKFKVIPPGVNTQIFTTAPDAQDRRFGEKLAGDLGGKAGPFIIVSNRLDEKKNTLGVVKAFARSQTLRGRARLVLCIRGIDDPFNEIANLPSAESQVLGPILEAIEVGGIRDKVHFLNLRSQMELAATYRILAGQGSLFALTAFYEPFGLAPIEAAACGLACVATKNGGPSEIFEDGSGVLVDPFDIADIARGLKAALEAQGDLSARARRRVLETYTWQKTAAGYISAIAEALEKEPGSARPIPQLDAAARIKDYLGRT